MVAGLCHTCGREEYLPFECRFCRRPFCATHRLPESHACASLPEYRERARASGRFFGAEWRSPVRRGPSVRTRLFGLVRGSMNRSILAALVGVYVLEWALILSGVNPVLMLGLNLGRVAQFPWTAVTSVFAHDPVNPFHLLVNGLILYFFGPYLEREIGPGKFLGFFLLSGMVAGFAQVLLFGGTVLGASGALMGILGVVTVLYPNITVIFIIFPMPLYAMTAIFAFLDVFFLGRDGIAHIAHLAGLAIGVVYGYELKKRLVRRRAGVEMLYRRY